MAERNGLRWWKREKKACKCGKIGVILQTKTVVGMKRFVWMVMAVGLLLACGGGSKNSLWRLQQVGDVIESRPDSALALLEKMDVASMTEEERAEYGLLMTMADIKTRHEQIKNDSMIAASVRYYDQHGDKWHQAMAYHYRGVVRYALKNIPEAIKDLKRAETLAETLDDELLQNKIYERLAYCNYRSNNTPQLLRYSQKLLGSSRKMNDSVMVARSYLMVASGFDFMGMKDSARIYVLNSLDWIDALNDSLGRNDVLESVAMMYQDAGEVEKAEQYLTDWVLNHSHRGRAYATLAYIRQKQGRYKEAVSCAQKALEAADHNIHTQSLDLLAQLYSQMGDSSQAYAMQRRSKDFSDSLASARKTSQMADWQMKYDEERQSKELYRRTSWMLLTIITLAVVVAVAIALGSWWHRRKVRRLSFRLDEDARRISELRTKIEQLEKSGEDNEQEMARLKEELENRMERISGTLLLGTQMYSQLQQHQCIAQATAKELQCMVDYFAQLRPKRWQEWERKYKNLSTAQYVFLIMQDDLRYDDEAIAAALDVKRPSVRSMRSRIKGRER